MEDPLASIKAVADPLRLQLDRRAQKAPGKVCVHAHAVEMGREGVPLNVIQRQLGHTNLRVTSIYLQG